MKLLHLKIAIFGLLMLIAVSGYGQHNTKISGTLTDSLTHGPIPFATVALLSQQTKAPVKGTQTDSIGHFVLENVPGGTFALRISFVGYNSIIKENILINPATSSLNLGTLPMTASKNKLLTEVVITGKKEALRNIDGKKVFAVDQSLVSKGGNAADLLQNVPTLQIDGYGNVSLRGSTNVKVLVDGKPSIIANGDITQILQSIPASAIESIEVIPNPPANYDANGEGIINIILKKNSRPGLNGSADIAGGTNDNYNGDASLSYQSGKVNVFGNYSLKDGNALTTGFQRYTFLQPTDSVVYTNETFPYVTRNKIQFVKAGIDYSLTPGSTLGISNAAKFNINEPDWDSLEGVPKKLVQNFDHVPVVHPDTDIGRPLYLRRGTFFSAIASIFKSRPDNLATSIFCGDVWELDLGLPAAMGANIHLIERASPFDTYDYERHLTLARKHKGRISKDLNGLLEWLK